MAMTLTGIVRGMRVVGNKEENGPDGHIAAGEKWKFLSMEISDIRSGTHSCQLSTRDKQFGELVDLKTDKLLNDLTDHKVKVIVAAISPGLRDVTNKDGSVVDQVPTVRIRITGIRDLGLPGDED